MAGKQEYNQLCPIASALDVIGSRWALLVLRELALGPRRFGDIHAGLETASTDMVTSRLRELEAAGLVERTEDKRYRMTTAGLALGPMMRSMMVWSMQTGSIDDTGADGSPRSFGPDPVRRVMGLLSLILRTTQIDDASNATVALTCDQLELTATPRPFGYHLIEAPEGTTTETSGTITITPEALVGLVVGDASVDALLATCDITTDTADARQALQHVAAAVAATQLEIAQPIS